MKRLLLMIGIGLCSLGAHAACTGVAAGSTAAQIQTAVNNCATAGGGTVALAAGTYNINGTITVPCTVSISGPVIPYSQTHYQTAVLIGSVTQPFHTTASCGGSPPYQHLSYIEWNGNQQSNGGGGVYVVPGTNGFVVDHNYFHGASTTSSYPGCCSEVQVYLGDNYSSALTQNIQITLNEFGPETNGQDCGPAMTALSTSSNGGFCNGVGSTGQLKNISVDHNIFHNLEQGAKVAEACNSANGHGCQPGTGDNPPSNGNTQNYQMEYNWFYNIQRIPFETQSNYYNTATPTTQFIEYNVLGNRNQGGGGQQNFDLSIANGCGNPPATPNCTATILGNANIQNVSVPGAGFEFWGDSNSVGNYNLTEGYPAPAGGAFDYAQSGQFNFVGNIFNMVHGGSNTSCARANAHGGFWNNEDSPSADPVCSTGNTYSTTGTGTYTSVAPTISPSSGTFTGTQTVTLTNGAGATNLNANTSIWYTTDGSTPVPGSGTAQIYTAPFMVSGGSPITVNAVGMWGAVNQPHSYPSSYGFVPSSTVSATYTPGAGYYISPSGSDSNAGTSGSPWASPNHSVPCGTVIAAQTGTYSAANFQSGKWGAVTGCGSGSAANVAWVTCATFDACKITTSGQSAVQVGAPYWGISGFEASTTSPGYACFNVQPSGTTSVHHVIFANNVANGCYGGGFQATQGSSGPTVDYINFIGNISWNASQGSDACHSGLTLGFIKQLDANAGTHILIAGNYAWDNFDPNPCAGTAPTDGEGMELDTLDQYTYTGQVYIENNLFVGNGGRGLNINDNNCNNASTCTTYAAVYVSGNTTYGNNTQAGQAFPLAHGEIEMTDADGVTATNNLAMTSQGTTGGDAIYAYAWNPVGTGNSVAGNWLYSAAGNTTFGSGYGTNTTGTNPAFASVTIPGAPSCSGTANTVACAATLINNFNPTATGSTTYGYQPPTGTSVTDPLYPVWLCNVTLPSGIINPGCGSSSLTLTGGYQANTGSLNSIAIGATGIQQSAVGTFSDGSTHTLPYDGYSPVWSATPGTGSISITTGGLVTGATAGTATSVFTTTPAPPGGVTFSNWGWTVTSTTPIVSGGYLGNPGSVNTIAIGGGTIPFTAYVSYSNIGGTNALPDPYDNVVSPWAVIPGTSTCGTINSSGVFTPTTVGTCNVEATCYNTATAANCAAQPNQWTMHVTASVSNPAPPEITVIVIGP